MVSSHRFIVPQTGVDDRNITKGSSSNNDPLIGLPHKKTFQVSWISFRKISFFVYRILRSIARASGTTHQIALGFAIGLFVAWLPFEGFQMLTAAAIATLFSANRPVAVMAIWFTNPVTYVPIYTFNYWFGSLFVGGPPLSEVGDLIKRIFTLPVASEEMSFFVAWWDNLKHSFNEIVSMGWDILVPLWIGGTTMGLFLSVVSYYVIYRYVDYFRYAIERKVQSRADRYTRRMEARTAHDDREP